MAFEIRFLDEPEDIDEGVRSKFGRITLGSFEERFLAEIHFWSAQEYEESWRRALEEIVGRAVKTALVTNFANPDEGYPIVWWPMYREGEDVVVQNQLLLPELAPKPFTLECAIAQVGPRRSVNEDGERISQWRVSVTEIREFLGAWQ